MVSSEPDRFTSFGQDGGASTVDRFGVWLSRRQNTKSVRFIVGKDVCGFDAMFMRGVLDDAGSALLVDVSLVPDLFNHPRVNGIEGLLPDALNALPDHSLDVALCMSMVEHLWELLFTLAHFRRLLRPGGFCAAKVPSWRGKRALELSAFKLGWSPAYEMDDPKAYYNPRDLWPLMVRAGFLPHSIKCFRYKFGLNTFAVCTVDLLDDA